MKKFKDINDLNHVKEILDGLKPHNKLIDSIPEDSIDYEMETERIGEQLCEIDEFIIGMEKISQHNLINADLRMMTYWSYLKEEITFEELLKSLKEYCSK